MQIFVRCVAAGLCLLLSACLTPTSLENRPLEAGVSREFEADLDRTSIAAIAALRAQGLPVATQRASGDTRLIRFDRPIDADGWGEIGRLVIAPVDADTTRVTVAYQNRYRPQPTRLTEAEFAAAYFGDLETALSTP